MTVQFAGFNHTHKYIQTSDYTMCSTHDTWHQQNTHARTLAQSVWFIFVVFTFLYIYLARIVYCLRLFLDLRVSNFCVYDFIVVCFAISLNFPFKFKRTMRPFIVIRQFECADTVPRKDLIKQYAMSFAFDAFTSCLFREVNSIVSIRFAFDLPFPTADHQAELSPEAEQTQSLAAR